MLDSDAPKSGVLKWLEKPVPLKLRNFEPKAGGGAFEALSSCLVTR